MIGNRLKRAREALGLSLRDLEAAIQAQVSAQAIGKYERDEMMPSSTVLLALAKALQVTPEYLLSERDTLAADAARYRWLRERTEGVEFRDGARHWRSDSPRCEELDAIIDAALAALKGG